MPGGTVTLLYQEQTKLIQEACYEVWKEFGGAFKEKVVDRALDIALRSRGLKVEAQKHLPLYFKNEKVGEYIPDKVVNESILLELKAKPFVTREDIRQAWLYLKGTDYKLILLINFGAQRLTFKRLVYDEARNRRSSA